MVTFKSNNFCFTLNKNAVAYILSGKSSINESEKEAVFNAKSAYYDNMQLSGDVLAKWGSISSDLANDLKLSKTELSDARLNCTLISIVTFGGTIDIKARDVLHIVNKLKKKDDDFHIYVSVNDIVGYIDYKLNDLDIGYVDFESQEIIAELEDFCRDKVDSRKVLITKSLVLKDKSTVELSDYLVHFFQNDGNYMKIEKTGGDFDE